MLVGHFAVGLAAKRVEPTISLGTLVLASMMADLLWCIFMIAGIEHVQFKAGMGAANYFAASDIVISHSFMMDGVWASLLATGYFLRRRYPRGAWVLFGAVLSHWLLDWISHRPDMPIAPGVHRHFGLGLWASIPASIILEGGIWLVAVVLYARSTYPTKVLRILELRRRPHAGVVQQPRWATTSRSANGSQLSASFSFHWWWHGLTG